MRGQREAEKCGRAEARLVVDMRLLLELHLDLVEVREGVLDLDAAVRIEGQHLLQKVEGVLVGAGVEPRPWYLWLIWQ